VRHVAAKIVDKMDDNAADRIKLNSFASRMKGCLRAAGRGHHLVIHLRARPQVDLSTKLLEDILSSCAPPTSTRPASNAGAFRHLYVASRLEPPSMWDVDNHWQDLLSPVQRVRFYSAVSALPGKWRRHVGAPPPTATSTSTATP